MVKRIPLRTTEAPLLRVMVCYSAHLGLTCSLTIAAFIDRPALPLPNGFGVRRQRRLSVTMPGSLFPRSESLEPENATPAAPQLARHVSFASTPLELSRRHHSNGDRLHHPVPFGESELEVDSVPSEQDSPLLRCSTSLKASSSQVDGSRGTSASLPNSTASSSSATSPRSPSRSPSENRVWGEGAQPSMDEPSISPTRKDKGKGKAMDDPFLNMDPNISGVIRFRGKQKELDDAREEFLRRERNVEQQGQPLEDSKVQRQDKLKIRMLEQEIEKLKAEVIQAAHQINTY